AVVDHAGDLAAKRGVMDEEPEQEAGDDRNAGQQERVASEGDAGEAHPAEQAERAVDQVGLDPPDQPHDVLEDEEERERRQQSDYLVRSVDAPQEQSLDERPDRQADGDGSEQEERQGDPAALLLTRELKDEGRAEIGADGVEAPVRDVENPQHAEDE